MKLDGESTISALNLLFGGIPPHAKHFVVIAFFRGHMTDKSYLIYGTNGRGQEASLILWARLKPPPERVAANGL